MGAFTMLRARDGCSAGVSGSTGTEGVGEWYTALWPAKHTSTVVARHAERRMLRE